MLVDAARANDFEKLRLAIEVCVIRHGIIFAYLIHRDWELMSIKGTLRYPNIALAMVAFLNSLLFVSLFVPCPVPPQALLIMFVKLYRAYRVYCTCCLNITYRTYRSNCIAHIVCTVHAYISHVAPFTSHSSHSHILHTPILASTTAFPPSPCTIAWVTESNTLILAHRVPCPTYASNPLYAHEPFTDIVQCSP